MVNGYSNEKIKIHRYVFTLIVPNSVFYSCTFLGPFGGPRNSIFELSFETQSLEIALVE